MAAGPIEEKPIGHCCLPQSLKDSSASLQQDSMQPPFSDQLISFALFQAIRLRLPTSLTGTSEAIPRNRGGPLTPGALQKIGEVAVRASAGSPTDTERTEGAASSASSAAGAASGTFALGASAGSGASTQLGPPALHES